MSNEENLPGWVIRRYVVVKNRKVDKFETLPGATAHQQEVWRRSQRARVSSLKDKDHHTSG